jgi:hypothetical protein
MSAELHRPPKPEDSLKNSKFFNGKFFNGNPETYPPQDLIKWKKKEESLSRQQRWERGHNEMRNRKTSASWQNDTAELTRKEQMIISRLNSRYN